MFKPELHIKSAVDLNGGKSRVNLTHKCLTTAKIGQIIPIYHQACVPGDSFDVSIDTFSRFEPLSVPSYVNLKYNTMSVFVPYHQVVDGIDSWLDNQKYFKGVDTTLPKLTSAVLGQFFELPEISDVGSLADHNFSINRSGTFSYRLLTPLGWYCKKIFDNLGYRFGMAVNVQETEKYNALPLYAFAHAYNCYMSYSPNYNTSALSNLLEQNKRNPGDITASELKTIFTSILLCYENSFATNCWLRPYGSTTTSDVPFNHTDVNVLGSSSAISYGRNQGVASTTANTSFTSSQIRMLMMFDDYFRRSNYSGSKDIEQIYSRFGVKIDDYKTRYPYFLNSSTTSVQIGDVTSTADTEDAPIGGYAGKAIMSDKARFHFDCKDYGMIFTFAWYAPDVLYYEGCDKECLRLEPFDFYTPELDKGFADMVNIKEVQDGMTSNVFGYVPLYSQYLYGKDIISGNFTRFEGYDAWHFGRVNWDMAAAQSDSVVYLPNTGTVYERIFNISDTNLVDVDTCYMTITNNVSASRPMKDFSGKTELGEGGISQGVNGSQIS